MSPHGTDAIQRFRFWLRFHHPDLDPSRLRKTGTPGYWEVIGGCPGGTDCRHAFRVALGACDGTVSLTVYFGEHGLRDDRGRWRSPYEAWKAWPGDGKDAS